MAFPQDILDIQVELFYSGIWNDITADVRGAGPTDGRITIGRGRAAEDNQIRPSTCRLALNNRDGRYSPRNPRSPLFGLIGRNTPLRVSVGVSIRFVGEVAAWPPRWDTSGSDVWTPIQAAGLTRRLGRVQATLRDTVRRYLVGGGGAADLVGYWPLADPAGSTAGNALVGTDFRAMSTPDLPRFGEGDLHPWLPQAAKLTSDEGGASARTSQATPGGFVATWLYRADVTAAGTEPLLTTFRFFADQFAFTVEWGTGLNELTVRVSDEGVIIGTVSVDGGDTANGETHAFRFEVSETTGTFVNVFADIDGVNLIANSVDIGVSPVPAAGSVRLFWDSLIATGPVQVGQLAVWDTPGPDFADVFSAYNGHQGERPSVRFDRLLTEEVIGHAVVGSPDDEEVLLGPQFPGKLVDLLREIDATGMGWLYEDRSFRGYVYRTIGSAYNQTPTLELDYAAGQLAPPLKPVEDDQQTANDVTATRRLGGQVRRVQTAGPLNVNDPTDDPDGIGRYDTSIAVNVAGAGNLLANQAGWRLHLGTTDEARFPLIQIQLQNPQVAADPALFDAAAALDIGDRLTIDNLPSWLPPEQVTQLAQGLVETLSQYQWDIAVNCTPESPYHIAEVEHPDFATIGSAAATTAQLTITETDTAFRINAEAGPDWVHEVDFDILIGGERMTVTAVLDAGGTFPNRLFDLTVTRSVNGVVKAHGNDAPIEFFHKSYIGL